MELSYGPNPNVTNRRNTGTNFRRIEWDWHVQGRGSSTTVGSAKVELPKTPFFACGRIERKALNLGCHQYVLQGNLLVHTTGEWPNASCVDGALRGALLVSVTTATTCYYRNFVGRNLSACTAPPFGIERDVRHVGAKPRIFARGSQNRCVPVGKSRPRSVVAQFGCLTT